MNIFRKHNPSGALDCMGLNGRSSIAIISLFRSQIIIIVTTHFGSENDRLHGPATSPFDSKAI